MMYLTVLSLISSRAYAILYCYLQFPPFSNNEIGLTTGNSRREIGHGKVYGISIESY